MTQLSERDLWYLNSLCAYYVTVVRLDRVGYSDVEAEELRWNIILVESNRY